MIQSQQNRSESQTSGSGFLKEIQSTSGVNLSLCYQCSTCTLGCPTVFAMDYKPNQLVRMIQVGLKKPVLQSKTIWVCASCETCVTRCPNNVDIPGLMDTLRSMSLKEGLASVKPVTSLNRAFLNSIKLWGRQHELSMLIQFKLMTGDLFGDVALGVKMLLKGKLKLLPGTFKDKKSIEAIFRESAR